MQRPSVTNHSYEIIECHMGFENDNTAMDAEHHTSEDDLMVGNSIGRELVASEVDATLEPYEGMEFESEEAAKAFYNSYARLVGFSTRNSVTRRSMKDGTIISRRLVCSKEGFHVKKNDKNEAKRPREVTRVGCKAMLLIKKQESGKWVVTKFEKEHNHELVTPDKVYCLRSHRHISGTARSLIHTLQGVGMGASSIMSVLIKESGGISNVGFTERDCRNYISNFRQSTLDRDAQKLLDHLKSKQAEDPDFFYAIQGDRDPYLCNIFWVDTRMRIAYDHFGDAVTFDTTYRTNRYRTPFASFTGVNHHGQPALFGCAVLLDESDSSFHWLFTMWLSAMSGRHPISITTDHDRAIRESVSEVFPQTRHRFYRWHILRKSQEKLSHVYLAYPSFQAEFSKCVNRTETIDEFESFWDILLDKYNVRDNEWLETLYNSRRQWIPVYLRDTFFAELSLTQISENINSFFDGYINAQTNLQMFVTQYEKAVENRHEKELKADSDTMCAPALKTPSPMEKQAANLYTKRIFTKFQEELVETLVYSAKRIEGDDAIGIYRVEKFEDDKVYTVTFNVSEMGASCSCQMFEFSGILCSHILTVFRVRNVLTLPSHYILKRWTKNAKNDAVLVDQEMDLVGNCLESQTLRYNNLRHQAIKFIEENATSMDILNVAIITLREASEKVSSAKKNTASVMVSGKDDIISGDQQATLHSHLTDDAKDKKIQELMENLERAHQRCESYRSQLLAKKKSTKA